MAGRGIVLGVEQVQFSLRFVHLGKADVHCRSQRARRKRTHLSKRQPAKIERCLRDLEDGL